MTDIVCAYTLTSSGGTIIMNNGTLGDGTDKYWLTQGPKGLSGPTLRTPFDPVAFGDGGRIYRSFKGPRQPIFDGMYLIESSSNQADCAELRNNLSDALNTVLDAMIAPNSGTLSYTPDGSSAVSLTVYYFVPLDDSSFTDNYRVQNFTFGLFSEAADL